MFTRRIDDDLELRLLEERDAEALFAIFEADREYLTQWLDWPNRYKTLEECKGYVSHFRRLFAEGKGMNSAMVYKGKLVGACDLYEINMAVRKATLGYWIAQEYQGKGIVTKSCRSVLAYAFETMSLNRVALQFKRANAERENYRSRAMAERLGFVHEGSERQGGMTNGECQDMVTYSLLAKEWREADA